ncbi:MAG: diguanylate cyclase with sensor [Candidatus Angelobacter sp.]|nr:diguanylate cyclase with sensor [Candidatus Angelobacter sp.]
MADISKRLEKAEKYLQRSKPEAALEEYLDILADEPRNDQVRQAAADLCLLLDRRAQAVELFSALLEHEFEAGESAKGSVTYKKLCKITTPTPVQTFQYAQLTEKRDRKEALDAYTSALQGFERQKKDKQALAACKRIVELSPTIENLQLTAEKASALGEGKTASSNFVQLGLLQDQELPGSGFQSYERAFNFDPLNFQAIYLYGRGLFSRNEVQECLAVLEPVVTRVKGLPELRELYAHALMAARRPAEAEPFTWEAFEKDPQQLEEVTSLVGVYLDINDTRGAMELAKRLETHETAAGRRREFITSMYEMSDRRLATLAFTEYLVKLFDTANREHEYSHTLLKLFQLYYNAGKYGQAGETLDRAAELDPYEPGHAKRLEMLRGRIDNHEYSRIANRFHRTENKPQAAAPAAPEPAASAPVRESEPTVLEDFILQAEIYLQYGMRSKALERLERLSKLFPREEQKNDKLRHLYISAGFTPQYQVAEAAARATSNPAPKGKAATPAPSASPAPYEENAVDNFARVTEITRNIYRQANVKSVLFTAVNDIGRHFNASRCVAGLCTVGKPPSAALEYCAPGIKQSDVMAIVKLIGLTQQLAANGVVNITNAKASRELAPAAEHIHTLNIESLLAVPLLDSGEQSGILILEQTAPRQWQQTDVVVLKTIAEQMVLAVSNVRLRTLMKTLAVTDEKSGLLKRPSYLDVLLSEVRRSLQQKTPLTLMLLHFGKASAMVKEIGEAPVESMMQQIGQTLASHIRQNDVAIRYDLTTIALVLSDTTEKNAFLVVDKMRKVLAPTKVPGTERTPPISAGIAEAVLQERFDAVDMVTEVINRVESALEMARAEGGNKAHSLAPVVQSNAVV